MLALYKSSSFNRSVPFCESLGCIAVVSNCALFFDFQMSETLRRVIHDLNLEDRFP